jgi:hypothetical protein
MIKDATPQVSVSMQRFIIALVNDGIIHPENFESSKKHLKAYCENEQLNFSELEHNLSLLFELLEDYRKTNTFILYRFLKLQAKFCFINEHMFGLLPINHLILDDCFDDTEDDPSVYCNKATASISSAHFGGIVGGHLIGL